MGGAFLGPAFSDDEIRHQLDAAGAIYHRCDERSAGTYMPRRSPLARSPDGFRDGWNSVRAH